MWGFVSKQEYDRLAESRKFWRGRALSYEADIQRLNGLLLSETSKGAALLQETAFTVLDRCFTSVLKTHAVGDQIKSSVSAEPPQSKTERYQKELDAFLVLKKQEWVEKVLEAQEAGVYGHDPEAEFQKNRQLYVAEFDSQYFPQESVN
jgi:hypothetical protein